MDRLVVTFCILLIGGSNGTSTSATTPAITSTAASTTPNSKNSISETPPLPASPSLSTSISEPPVQQSTRFPTSSGGDLASTQSALPETSHSTSLPDSSISSTPTQPVSTGMPPSTPTQSTGVSSSIKESSSPLSTRTSSVTPSTPTQSTGVSSSIKESSPLSTWTSSVTSSVPPQSSGVSSPTTSPSSHSIVTSTPMTPTPSATVTVPVTTEAPTTPKPPTTERPRPTQYPPRPPDIVGRSQTFPMSLKANTTYNNTLQDKQSPIYKAYMTEFTDKITTSFTGVTAFERIDIQHFAPENLAAGKQPLIVSYKPAFNLVTLETARGNINSTDIRMNTFATLFSQFNLTEEIQKKVIPEQKKMTFNISKDFENVGTDADYLDSTTFQELNEANTLLRDYCKSVDFICDTSYDCQQKDLGVITNVTCHYKCDNVACPANAYCVIDSSFKPVCRCNNDYYLAEDNSCKKKLPLGMIIGIAAGGGGGLIVVLIILMGLAIYKWRQADNKLRQAQELHIQDEMFDDFTPPIKNNLANKNNQFQETPLWAKEDPNARQMQPYNNTNENEAATMMAAVYAETRKPGAQDNQGFVPEEPEKIVNREEFMSNSLRELLKNETYKNFNPFLGHIDPKADYSIKRPSRHGSSRDTDSFKPSYP